MGTRPSRFPNSFGRLVYAVAAIVLPAIALGASPFFRISEYWGSWAPIGLAVFSVICVFALLSPTVFVSVTIKPGAVILRGIFLRTIIRSGDVDRIELDPPVQTLSLEWRFGKPWSAL